MKYLVLACCILCLCYPIYLNEKLKYQHALHDCREIYEANQDLLMSSICMNPRDRLRFKNAGTVYCDKAERENRLSPIQCAFQQWWYQTEFFRLYFILASSYWSILPIICFTLYLYYKRSVRIWSETKFYEKQEKFIEQMSEKRIVDPDYIPPTLEL